MVKQVMTRDSDLPESSCGWAELTPYPCVTPGQHIAVEVCADPDGKVNYKVSALIIEAFEGSQDYVERLYTLLEPLHPADKFMIGVDNGDGTATFTNVDGTTLTVASENTFMLAVDNGDDTATFTNVDGTTVTVPTQDTFMLAVDNGDDTATLTNVDGSTVNVLTGVDLGDSLANQCYALPALQGSLCKVTKVAYAEDDAGCGGLYRLPAEYLPQGYRPVVETISGTFTTTLTGSDNWPGSPTAPDLSKEVIHTAQETFTVAAHPGLACVGTKLSMVATLQSLIKVTHVSPDGNGVPGFPNTKGLQWGFAMSVNGVEIKTVSDNFFFHNEFREWTAHGGAAFMDFNDFARQQFRGSEISGAWTADGNDAVVQIVQYAIYAQADAGVVNGYQTNIDLSTGGVRFDLA